MPTTSSIDSKLKEKANVLFDESSDILSALSDHHGMRTDIRLSRWVFYKNC